MVPKGPTSTENLRPQIAFVFWGTFALGFGSALLLPGPLVWRFGGGTDAFVLRTPAVVIHFVGWMFLLASLKAFPFVPSVFAPVVVGHAIFFRLESRMLGPIAARTVTRAALLLGGLAVTSIVIQAAGLFSGWAYL